MKGSIRPTKAGSWELRAFLGRDPVTNRPRYKSRTVRGSRRDTEKSLRQMLHDVDEGRSKSTDATVGHLLDRWYEDIAAPNLSPTTLRRYRSIIDIHLLPGLGENKLRKLDSHRLDAFYATLTAKGLAPRSVRQAHAIIARALNQALRWGWVDRNPASLASPPRVSKADVHPPTPEDVRRLLEAAGPELGAILFFAATSGARRGEVCGLRWHNVDWQAGAVLIQRTVVPIPGGWAEKDTKTHAARRIALDPATMEVLRRHHTAMQARADDAGVVLRADGFVFSKSADGAEPWHPDSVTGAYRRLRGSVGMDAYRLHDLRHGVATQLLAAGVDVRTVAGRLGHANPNITLMTYAHFLPEADRRAAGVMGALVSDRAASDEHVPLVLDTQGNPGDDGTKVLP